MTHFIFLLNTGDLEGDDYPTHLPPEVLPPVSWIPHQWALWSAQHQTFPAALLGLYPTHPALQPIFFFFFLARGHVGSSSLTMIEFDHDQTRAHCIESTES